MSLAVHGVADNVTVPSEDPANELQNIATRKGKSKLGTIKSSDKHFNNFLLFIGSTKRSIDEFTVTDISGDLLGKFSDYIYKHVPSVTKKKTHLGYIEAKHGQMLQILNAARVDPHTLEGFKENYKNLRHNTESDYNILAAERGESAINHYEVGCAEDIEYIARKILGRGL
jgi:hypothetical protein